MSCARMNLGDHAGFAAGYRPGALSASLVAICWPVDPVAPASVKAGDGEAADRRQPCHESPARGASENGLDANVFVRLLIADDAAKTRRARQQIVTAIVRLGLALSSHLLYRRARYAGGDCRPAGTTTDSTTDSNYMPPVAKRPGYSWFPASSMQDVNVRQAPVLLEKLRAGKKAAFEKDVSRSGVEAVTRQPCKPGSGAS